MNLKTADTYIYIDVSNIRGACLRSCGLNIDFIKLYNYFKNKYPSLKDVRYYEGISNSDQAKHKHFDFLANKVGYTICALERKEYIDPPHYNNFECSNCGVINTVKVSPRTIKLKSNVDVYLASDMLELVATIEHPVHIILLSCDGDYAEAIRSVLRISPTSCVTVLATPITRPNNCLSMRLQKLRKELKHDNYVLDNIYNIREKISQPFPIS